MRKKDKGKGKGREIGKRIEKGKCIKIGSRLQIGVDTNNDEKRKKVWNKKSIFFQLEYWKHLLMRHNLDVMHIKKNVCNSIFGTLLSILGKTKDSLASRLDLVEIKVRPELAP